MPAVKHQYCIPDLNIHNAKEGEKEKAMMCLISCSKLECKSIQCVQSGTASL